MNDKLLGTDVVARELGISRRGVQKLIERGRLQALRFGHTHMITEAELTRYKSTARKPGRPAQHA